ncbi:hypothetical protein EYF80_005451 [Liparis tanakae]|uniref:Uncharacterized protein n=1 Tax=Liparis tanakae TaxID=230148 RepID=A0A4Z2J2P9_9TELE|nr:hypothetical protein EYF80_005451 [Liparis tanakae]
MWTHCRKPEVRQPRKISSLSPACCASLRLPPPPSVLPPSSGEQQRLRERSRAPGPADAAQWIYQTRDTATQPVG